MSEWKTYRLGDICQVLNGRAYKQEELLNQGPYPVLRVGNILQGNNWYYSDLELPDDKYCYNGDLLYAWSCGFAPYIWKGKKSIYHYHIWKLKENTQIIDKLFFYYYLIIHTKYNLGGTHGSVMLHLTKKDFENQTLHLPPLDEQRRIAGILGSLDDKIELNRRINANLEAQAQALFRSWFVDFEPFRDGPFVDSQLGKIPQGWKVGNLLDIAELFDYKRKPLSSREREKMQKIYPYYGATSIMDFVDNYIFDGIYLLMGEDGSVANAHGYPYLQYVFGKFWPNNHAHVMQGKNGYTTEMLHCLLLKKNITSIVTGAVQPKISQANMKKILVPLPPDKVCSAFADLINPIYSTRRNSEKEISNLSALRDTLLPKLMAGEIKI